MWASAVANGCVEFRFLFRSHDGINTWWQIHVHKHRRTSKKSIYSNSRLANISEKKTLTLRLFIFLFLFFLPFFLAKKAAEEASSTLFLSGGLFSNQLLSWPHHLWREKANLLHRIKNVKISVAFCFGTCCHTSIWTCCLANTMLNTSRAFSSSWGKHNK